jgi:hypothetical protein
MVILLLGGVTWLGSHQLDPARPLVSDNKAIEIQVVSLDWKWLFIYPNYGVASVNELVVPAGVPLHFTLTSASVLNTFFVPQLGSMIYTMHGMATEPVPACRRPRHDTTASRPISAATASPTCISRCERVGGPIRRLDHDDARGETAARHRRLHRARAPEASSGSRSCSALSRPTCSTALSSRRFRRGRDPRSSTAARRRNDMWGKLSWAAIPLDEPLPLVSAAVVGLVLLGTLAWVVAKGHLPYLWKEWLSSVDHKKIGIMYIVLALVMLLRGFSDALLMRAQQAVAVNAPGFLPPDHYNQIFSAHGTLMIFFVAMPFVIGLMNFVVPLQLGARDVAFPTLNSVGFWLTATGALLVNISLVVGEFARTGWLPYPPLSELAYSPGVGVDYYLWSLQISGVGTLLSGINLVTTVLKVRAPGMTYLRMPMFCWTTLASNLLIVAAFPILTATLAMLLLDRYLGFHFFTNDGGGNAMMFMNLIWAWGHPEVYILILPAFGIFSEVASTFSSKPLFGYRSMVVATMAICIISFMVWLHHFFTMGAGPNVNAIFGIATMVIAVPTGVKIFNWLFTMYGGRIRFTRRCCGRSASWSRSSSAA